MDHPLSDLQRHRHLGGGRSSDKLLALPTQEFNASYLDEKRRQTGEISQCRRRPRLKDRGSL